MLLSEIFNPNLTETSVEDVNNAFQDPYPKDIDIDECGLTELKGCPSQVKGHFNCSSNNLKSLKGGPKLVSDYYDCEYNQLESLEGIAEHIGDALYAQDNKITSLHNIHKHIKHISRFAQFRNNPITSHVLGLMLIDGLKRVSLSNSKVQEIMNKHLGRVDRDVFACQEELIENGLEDFAQL